MTDMFEYPEFVVKMALNFSAIRVVGSRLIPTNWKLQAELIYDEDDETEDAEEVDLEIKVATAQVNFWVNEVLNGSIIYSVDNEWASMALFDEEGMCTVANNIVMLPTDPSDDVIAEIIHSKLNAIGGEFLKFGIIELTSDDKSGLTFMFTGEGEQNLPVMKDWVGERSFYDKPWWARNDVSTVDIIPEEDEDLTAKPIDTSEMDFIRKTLMRQAGKNAIVVKPNFKPVVIDGGTSN